MHADIKRGVSKPCTSPPRMRKKECLLGDLGGFGQDVGRESRSRGQPNAWNNRMMNDEKCPAVTHQSIEVYGAHFTITYRRWTRPKDPWSA